MRGLPAPLFLSSYRWCKMGNRVPSLSASGWVEEISERADKLMAYYLTSDYSQSEIYAGTVVSLQYHIEQYGHNTTELRTHVENGLRGYFERYFDSAEVTLTINDPTSDDDNRTELKVECYITDNGSKYSLGRLIAVIDSKVVSFIDINN